MTFLCGKCGATYATRAELDACEHAADHDPILAGATCADCLSNPGKPHDNNCLFAAIHGALQWEDGSEADALAADADPLSEQSAELLRRGIDDTRAGRVSTVPDELLAADAGNDPEAT